MTSPLGVMGRSSDAWRAAAVVGHVVFIAALIVAVWELQQDNWTPWEDVTAANPRVKRTPNVKWLVCVAVTRCVQPTCCA